MNLIQQTMTAREQSVEQGHHVKLHASCNSAADLFCNRITTVALTNVATSSSHPCIYLLLSAGDSDPLHIPPLGKGV